MDPTPTKLGVTLLHAVVAAWYCFVTGYDLETIPRPDKGYKTSLMYLTRINMYLQAVYSIVALVKDFIDILCRYNPMKETLLKTTRDRLFVAIIFPIGAFVSLSFWAIYAVDRELVYPKRLDAVIPIWINHGWHTSMAITLPLELYAIRHVFPKNRATGMAVTGVVTLSYVAWVFLIYHQTEFWVYPVLAILSWPRRVAFMAVMAVFMLVLYPLGQSLSEWTWPPVTVKGRKRH